MKSLRRGWSPGSLKVKLVGGVLFLTVPLILVMIIGSNYAIGVVRTQVSESYRNMMALYVNQLDADLEKVDKYLNGLIGSGMDLFAVNQASNENDYYRAKISLFIELKEHQLIYPSIHAFFMYASKWDDFMPVYKEVENAEQALELQRYIVNYIRSAQDQKIFFSNRWDVHEVNGPYYIIHMIKADDVYIGAWQRADALIMPLNLIRFGDKGGSLLVTLDGAPMTNFDLVRSNAIEIPPVLESYQLVGKDERFLLVGEASSKANFRLIAVIPDEQILQNLPTFFRMATLAPLTSIVIVPIGLYFLRKVVLLPINRLVQAMKLIREGNLQARIEDARVSDEFAIMNQTFNSMMSQIQNLTINVYEEKLNKQREELQRMQLQMNPHFFLNSLNIIYHLAKVKDYDLIKEMSQGLIRHFRFMFRSNLTFVRLQEEVEHTTNYLRIQELRFPGQFHYQVMIPEYMSGELVPPLIIQTFVENTIKHAVTLDRPIDLSIRADIEEVNQAPYMIIEIEDTGDGFAEEILSKLQAGHTLVTEQGEHIGIWNVQRRLKLLYGDRASVRFSNRMPHGASVRISLPAQEVGGDAQPGGGNEDVQPADRG